MTSLTNLELLLRPASLPTDGAGGAGLAGLWGEVRVVLAGEVLLQQARVPEGLGTEGAGVLLPHGRREHVQVLPVHVLLQLGGVRVGVGTERAGQLLHSLAAPRALLPASLQGAASCLSPEWQGQQAPAGRRAARLLAAPHPGAGAQVQVHRCRCTGAGAAKLPLSRRPRS